MRSVEYRSAIFGISPEIIRIISITSSRLLLGAGLFFLSVSQIAFQDIASFGSTPIATELRWSARAVQIDTGSIYAARFGTGVDNQTTGSIEHRLTVETLADQPESLPSSGGNNLAAAKPLKINRALKGDRVISSTIKRPPVYFSAGSVIRKSSLLDKSTTTTKTRPVFVKLRKSYQPVQLAQAFLYRKPAMKIVPTLLKPAILLAGKKIEVDQSEGATTLVAYVPVDTSIAKPFKSLFRKSKTPFSPQALGNGDHPWAINKLPKIVTSKAEQNCLSRGIYFEARGESVKGQAAVAQVILNRVKNPAYPNTICGVVYQNKSWKNRCQFSFACDGIRDRVRSKKNWKTAVAVAKLATAGKMWNKDIGSATHYYATYVRPRWARTMTRMKRIGRHIFFRTKGGGWS